MPVLALKKVESNEENLLDLDFECVTISEDKNGENNNTISDKAKLEKADKGFICEPKEQKKVQVILPRMMSRNVILWQFWTETDTDNLNLSSHFKENRH